MRCIPAVLLGAFLACVAWRPALCQSAGPPASGGAISGPAGYGVQPVDPCAPAAGNNGGFIFGGIGSAIGMLGNLAGQSQRQQACAAQRQAQWEAYKAKLSAAAEQKQEAAAPAVAVVPAMASAPLPAPAVATPLPIAPPARQARAAAARRAASGRMRVADAASQSQATTLAAAEASPANVCREQAVARALLAAWNGIDRFKAHGMMVVDVEHLTTSAADRTAQAYTCHGVFVTSEGDRVMGSLAMRRNVVGDPIAIWTRDADQALSHYRPPALPDAPTACDGGSAVMAQASRW
jgi:hypothetical protein